MFLYKIWYVFVVIGRDTNAGIRVASKRICILGGGDDTGIIKQSYMLYGIFSVVERRVSVADMLMW